MTTLYREVEITTAEQADALPHATPIKIGPFLAWRMHGEWVMTLADQGYATTEDFMRAYADDWPYIALVPIEAEEETQHAWDGTQVASRLVTLWEDA